MNTEQEIFAIKLALVALSGFISSQFPHTKLDEFLLEISKKSTEFPQETVTLLNDMAASAASQRRTTDT